jgi:hypothetical protein
VIEIDDRLLAHLKVVIVTKLRRDEKFTFSWKYSVQDDEGRSTIWLHPAIPVQFVFGEDMAPELNREWLEALIATANTGDGLRLVPEPVPGTERSEPQFS